LNLFKGTTNFRKPNKYNVLQKHINTFYVSLPYIQNKYLKTTL